MCGPIGIDLILSRRILSDVSDALDVGMVVFIVLTWQ